MSTNTLKISNHQQVAIVDDFNYARLSKFVWQFTGTSIRRVYCSHNNQRRISLAAEVMNDHKGLYDHIDRNPFNNVTSNLRKCTVTQNIQNRVKWVKNSSSKYKGVCWHKKCKKWSAQIGVKKAQVHLGLFETEEAAALAYNKAALEHFGEFAHLNTFELSPTIVERESEKRQ